MLTMTARAREAFAAERRLQGKPGLGIQVGFVYGCGGAGHRVIFTEEPAGPHRLDLDGIVVALDAESAERMAGAVIDWEPSPAGFLLRHPDAALVEFC
jgi:Fe-S cluster assembly iron-binding protein IscA